MEDFTKMTPLTVGSPQQVIDRYAGMRDLFGDYQRQLFLMDHSGLPLKTVLEQLDLLGGEVVPVLRRELAKNRPGDGSGCADARRACARCIGDRPGRQARPAANRGDNLTTGSPYQDAPVAAGPLSVWPGREPEHERAPHRLSSSGRSVEPSSTRMLATACRRRPLTALRERDIDVKVDVIELRDLAHDITEQPAHRFRAGAARGGDQPCGVRRCADRGHPDLLHELLRTVWVVHRRARSRCAQRQPVLIGATRALRGTRSPSTTRSVRCSPTCMPSRSRPECFAASSDWERRCR
ncbi:hypothetical protein [Microbacterium sp.]|uniref:hypothetical protein n=1 Tax=Microbacterium sp. TaxID=51671 RepID=UPI003A943EE0